MQKKVFVGIDTSNYTTSCAICDSEGVILENFKELLPVKSGENGLRQSDAVFSHIKNLQIISSHIKEIHNKYEIAAIGYSAYPRDVNNSYMPCFLVGKAIAEMISALYSIPAFHFSHQAGHIQASLYSSGFESNDPFIAFHISGGTTEILYVKPNETTFDINLIGGSVDLHAGQAIDRIGVKMGMSFPCGKELEKSAMKNTDKLPPMKICVKGYSCNLSGLENLAFNLFEKTKNVSLVSSYVLGFISKTVEKLTDNLRLEYENIPIVYAGGVMSNKIIQQHLSNRFKNVFFSEPEFSADNGAGIALLARKTYLK